MIVDKGEPKVFKHFIAVAALTTAASTGLLAQAGAPAAAQREQHVQARYNIFVMEGVLERAVEHGADRLRLQVRRVMPDMLLLSGEAHARGFRLDGYGVFFDVAVPVMRQTFAWSLRTMMNDGSPGTRAALQQIKAAIERMTSDTREKAALMQALKRLEIQVGPPLQGEAAPTLAGGTGPSERGTVTALDAPPEQQPEPALTPEEAKLLEDPNGAYEREVITALKDAMLEHSGPIRIGADEWLTVAAHDNEHRNRLAPADPYDLLTIVLRVKGSDLAAYRAERITLEEARKRVLVSEF